MKELRCKSCGESTKVSDLLKDNEGNYIYCPTCEGTKFLEIGTGEEIELGNKCENAHDGHTCEDLFDCCDCGGNDCGCGYCWSCNACDNCKGEE